MYAVGTTCQCPQCYVLSIPYKNRGPEVNSTPPLPWRLSSVGDICQVAESDCSSDNQLLDKEINVQ